MKKQSKSIGCVTGLAVALVFSCLGLHAQDIEYDKLKEKLTFDKAPPKDTPGLIASFADVIEEAAPSIVAIFSEKEVEAQTDSPMYNDPLFRRFFGIPEDLEKELPPRKERGLGSGVIISEDGYILTNNHVVGDADEIMVNLAKSKRDYKATLIGADPQTDVALIKIDAKDLNPITIGDSSYLRVGDVTLAIGNPFGLEQTVTHGIVSAMGRTNLNITRGGYENFIQTDASINRGNSGGALIDANGRLIGINTAIQSGVTGGNIGIGFAIPVNMALNIVEKLLDNDGEVKRGFLGVYMRELDANTARAYGREDRSGVLITDVGQGTPAEKAGIEPHDIITAYNGNKVQSMARFRLDISNAKPGDQVKLEIVRDGKPREVMVKLGDLSNRNVVFTGEEEDGGGSPAAQPEKEFIDGVEIDNLDEEMRLALDLDEEVNGVFVKSVEASSKAAEAGLRAGLIITQVDRTDVGSVADAVKVLAKFKGDVLLLQVQDQARRDILAVELTNEEE